MRAEGNMQPEARQALDQCESMMSVGSKSFFLAARLFERETRAAATFLYAWCRYCDDEVDLDAGRIEDPSERLQELRRRTEGALAGTKQNDAVFVAFQYVMRRYRIPSEYPLELLEGMAMDVRAERYENFDELLLYCYRVAGTVGLMMAHIMGVSDERALRHAADMGMAMQLTNIARDIMEDASRGRVYLPTSWLVRAGISHQEIADPGRREEVSMLARRLLSEADRLYVSGDQGLQYLPFRCAGTIAAARRIYAAIGQLILKRGMAAWDGRAYTSSSRKAWLAACGFASILASLPRRTLRPWSPVRIRSVWRFSEIARDAR